MGLTRPRVNHLFSGPLGSFLFIGYKMTEISYVRRDPFLYEIDLPLYNIYKNFHPFGIKLRSLLEFH